MASQNLISLFCRKPTGKYSHYCTNISGHKGKCSRTHVYKKIQSLFVSDKTVDKTIQDTYITPGNSGCCKNRADRCYVPRLTKEEIRELNIRKQTNVGIPVRHSSEPIDCFMIGIDLVIQSIAMVELSKLDKFTIQYKNNSLVTGLIHEAIKRYPDNLRCRICRERILEKHFDTEHSSTDENSVQIGHINPKIQGSDDTAHVSDNAHWIHRYCNTVQSDKTEEELFVFLDKITSNHKRQVL